MKIYKPLNECFDKIYILGHGFFTKAADMSKPLKTYFSRALEGPMEATFELKDELRAFLPTAIKTHLFIMISLVLLWLIFLIENIFGMIEIVLLAYQLHLPVELELWVFFGVKLAFLFLFAISLTVLLFVIQSLRFIGRFSGKYRIIESLSEQDVGGDLPRELDKKEINMFQGDPISVILEMLDNINAQLPQFVKMFRLVIILFACLPVLIGFSLFYTFLYGNLVGFSTAWYLDILGFANILLKMLFILLSIVAIYFSYGSLRFFLLLQKRRMVIDNIRFDLDNKVPGGKDTIERFVTYLKATEPLLKKSEDIKPLERGVSTANLKLDGLLTARVKGLSRIYTNGGHTACVYVKVYNRRLKISDINEFGESVNTHVLENKVYPLRMALLLRGPAADLDDEVYRYVLENPAFVLGWEEHYVQLVSEEDGRFYSFIPNIGSPP